MHICTHWYTVEIANIRTSSVSIEWRWKYRKWSMLIVEKNDVSYLFEYILCKYNVWYFHKRRDRSTHDKGANKIQHSGWLNVKFFERNSFRPALAEKTLVYTIRYESLSIAHLSWRQNYRALKYFHIYSYCWRFVLSLSLEITWAKYVIYNGTLFLFSTTINYYINVFVTSNTWLQSKIKMTRKLG